MCMKNIALLLTAGFAMSLNVGCSTDSRPPCADITVDAADAMQGYDSQSGAPVTLVLVSLTFGEQFGPAHSLRVMQGETRTNLDNLPAPDENNRLSLYLPADSKVIMYGNDMSADYCRPMFDI